jgi:hypothetical protein
MTFANISTRRTRSLLTPLLLLAALLGSACQSLPDPPGKNVTEIFHGTLETVQPADIVVAPITVEGNAAVVPSMELRKAFQRNLILRRYSALALPYTDRRVVNASYKSGSLYEDAILKIVVKTWDMSRWNSNKEVAVVMEAWMLSSEDESQLWGGRFEKTFYLKNEMANRPTEKGAFEETANQIAEALMEIMPARTPKP